MSIENQDLEYQITAPIDPYGGNEAKQVHIFLPCQKNRSQTTRKPFLLQTDEA